MTQAPSHQGPRGRRLALAVAALALTFLAACGAQFRSHGYAPTDAELQQILVGVDTRESVTSVLGRPGTASVVDNGDFFYLYSRWREFAFLPPEPIDRQLVAIRFDAEDVVSNVERFSLEDGRVVALSRRVTDQSVEDLSVIRQILGNIGGVDTGALIGEGI